MNEISLPSFQFVVTPEFNEYLNNLINQKVAEAINGTIAELPKEKKYITKRNVCDLMYISYPTCDSYCVKGILKRYKIGSRVLFLEEEVRQAIQNIPVKFSHR